MSTASCLSVCYPSAIASVIYSFKEEIETIEKINSIALSQFKTKKEDLRRLELLEDREKIKNYQVVFDYLFQLIENPIEEENPTQLVVFSEDLDTKALASFSMNLDTKELFVETIIKNPKLLFDSSVKGVGKRVLEYLIIIAKSHGLSKVLLSPTKESFGFYQKMNMNYDLENNKFFLLLD